jgi:hypothetical protein
MIHQSTEAFGRSSEIMNEYFLITKEVLKKTILCMGNFKEILEKGKHLRDGLAKVSKRNENGRRKRNAQPSPQ